MNHSNPPRLGEIEVSIFGPGFGEAIVVHYGDGTWLVVDSCTGWNTQKSAPLSYLQEMGVDVSTQVRMIVITHWHDDHIRGISDVVEGCESARVVVPASLADENFVQFLSIINEPLMLNAAGADEFAAVFSTLSRRKKRRVGFKNILYAAQNMRLDRFEIIADGIERQIELWALSPSHHSLTRSKLVIARLLEETKLKRGRIPDTNPNESSLVLKIELGTHQILLGADLESSSDPDRGWHVILNDLTQSVHADIFKVPHHGARSAYEPRIWSNLLNENPIALVAPFANGRQSLPTDEDVGRLCGHTLRAYITARLGSKKVRRNPLVDSIYDAMTETHYGVRAGWGHIRCRCPIQAKADEWSVELFGDARALV